MLKGLKSVKSINGFFDQWHEYSETEKLEIVRDLKTDGVLTVLGQKPDNTLRCPVYEYTLARPCGVGGCQYHIDSAENKNCLVVYLDAAKNNRLSAAEVASLLKSNISEINGVTNNAVRKIKKAVVKEQLEKNRIRRFNHLPGHCLACEVHIQNELDMGLNTDLLLPADGKLYGWCSLECKKTKPKWQFTIEKKFGCFYLDAMATAVSTYRKPEIVDQLLEIDNGITKSILGQIRQHLDRIA